MKKFFYRVKKGETLSIICRRFCIPVTKVIKDNSLLCEISEGDILFLEKGNKRVYSVKPMDTIDSIAKEFCVSKEELVSFNGTPYVFYGLDIYV